MLTHNCDELQRISGQVYAEFMVATDAEIIKICLERNIPHTDEFDFNRRLAIVGILTAIANGSYTINEN